MQTLTVKEKFINGFHLIENKIRPFFYSDYYIILICAIVGIGWVSKNAVFGFLSLVLVSSFVLIFSDDILPLTVNIFSALLLIYSPDVSTYLNIWPVFIVLAIAILFFLIRNFKRPKYKGKMLIVQLMVCFALLISGVTITTKQEILFALPCTLLLSFGVLFIYLLYVFYYKENSGVDTPKYFAKIFMYIGIVIGIELIIHIATSNIPIENWKDTVWFIGWANRNNISTYFLFTIPLVFYLSSSGKHILFYYLVALFQSVCLVLTFSRGGILFGFIMGILSIVFSIVKSPCKKKQSLCLVAVLSIFLIAYLCTFNYINNILQTLFKRGTDVSSRLVLWDEAIRQFVENPIFGRGIGYIGPEEMPFEFLGLYWFHSTIFEILGKLGIVGAICYFCYYLVRYKIILKNIKNPFNTFIFISWFAFECYSLMDTGTFIPYPFMMLVIVETFILEQHNNKIKQDKINAQFDNEYVLNFNYDEAV